MKMWSAHTGIQLSILKKKKDETLPLATSWMDLEGIMPHEVSQTEKDKYHMNSFYMGHPNKAKGKLNSIEQK